MPMAATCGPRFIAGGVNLLQGSLLNTRDFCYIKRSVTKGHARRHVETLRNLDNFGRPIIFRVVHDGVYITGFPRSGEKHAIRAKRHLPRIRDSGGIDLDAEAWP